MPKGRRPLPAALKELRGNPGKRKPNENEPEAVAGDPIMPKGLSAVAQAEWWDILPLLRAHGLSAVDGKALGAYCYAYDIWMMTLAAIEKHGVLIEEPIFGRKGTIDEETIIDHKVKKNPAVAIANEALKTMKSYLVEFGMTPASRGKLHVEKPKELDESDKFFAKKEQFRQTVN